MMGESRIAMIARCAARRSSASSPSVELTETLRRRSGVMIGDSSRYKRSIYPTQTLAMKYKI
jgi:hypothetical protein